MRRLLAITSFVASLATLLAVGLAVAQDATWKDCELAARNPDRSIAACTKLLKRPSSHTHAAAFHHRGQAFAAKGHLDQAISDISAGIRLDPQRAYRWQERGELYARQGKYQQAIADITEAIRKDPTPRAFRFQSRAEAYQSSGDLLRAVADFDEAIRLDPASRSFRVYARANALRDAGQYDRALADYATVLKSAKSETTKAQVLVDRGRTYARMGRSEAAKKDFDSALMLSPSNEELGRTIEVEAAALSGQSLPSTSSDQANQRLAAEAEQQRQQKQAEAEQQKRAVTEQQRQLDERARQLEARERHLAEEDRNRSARNSRFALLDWLNPRGAQKRVLAEESRLKRAYYNYSVVNLCSEFGQEFGEEILGDQKITDDELQRAGAAIREINKAIIAKYPAINPEQTFVEAEKTGSS